MEASSDTNPPGNASMPLYTREVALGPGRKKRIQARIAPTVLDARVPRQPNSCRTYRLNSQLLFLVWFGVLAELFCRPKVEGKVLNCPAIALGG